MDMLFGEAPYVVLIAGLLAGATSGLAFQATFKQLARQWLSSRSSRSLAQLRGPALFLPFLGMAGGSCAFLASTLQVFSLPQSFAYGFSVPLTVVGGWLVWRQFGIILRQVERGGVKAIDLDAFQ